MGGVARRPVYDRIMERIVLDEKTGCWVWTGATQRAGYGIIGEGRRKLHSTHRFMYQHTRGVVLSGEEDVCHRCDNPPCCNPEHLFVGSAADNCFDMKLKGRTTSPLTIEQVREIRARRETGESYTNIGKSFGVSKVTARNVCIGKTWSGIS